LKTDVLSFNEYSLYRENAFRVTAKEEIIKPI
jgi:hypothetical protein